jgi:hypothetical protein
MDALVRENIHAAFGFRFVVVPDYATALKFENAVKSGRLRAGRPRLNPSKMMTASSSSADSGDAG